MSLSACARGAWATWQMSAGGTRGSSPCRFTTDLLGAQAQRKRAHPGDAVGAEACARAVSCAPRHRKACVRRG